MTSARTKLVTSRRRTPVRASISTSRTLSGVRMISGSFWKPSRGPTSRTFTASDGIRYIMARPPLTPSVIPPEPPVTSAVLPSSLTGADPTPR